MTLSPPPRPAVGDPLALPHREEVLRHAASLVLDAWRSFDHPRAGQPPVTDDLRASLEGPLPEDPEVPGRALDHAARVLDASIAQSRPRFLAYVGSSGLEIGVLGDALMASHDVNVAVEAGGAGLLEAQAVRWASELVGFGAPGGIMASGGMISNLTALAAAREHALPGSRREGLGAHRLSLVCSSEVHYSVRRAAELLGIGTAGVRGAIERNLAQAAYLARLVDSDPSFELVLEPELSTVCFRYVPAGAGSGDAFHIALADAIQDDGDVYLAPARVDGRTCLRACFVNHRTTEDDVESVLPTVARVGRSLLG